MDPALIRVNALAARPADIEWTTFADSSAGSAMEQLTNALVLRVNGRGVTAPAGAGHQPLLWWLRERLGLKGTKYGCGSGACGACVVHSDGHPVRSCVTPLNDVRGKDVTTIESFAISGGKPIVDAFLSEQVAQCGYCQPGMVMTAGALLQANARPSDADIDEAMSGVLCTCGTYQRVRRAIHRAAGAPIGEGVPGPAADATTVARFAPDHRLNPWVRVGDDGIVTVTIDRAEMGQGVVTSLSMLVAEELEVDLARIRTEFAPVDPTYNNPEFGEQSTGGSTSVRTSWVPLRRAGASAREQLITAAALRWNVDRTECRAAHGAVTHGPTGRLAPYGELAAAAAKLNPPPEVPLKPPDQFQLIGRPTRRLDAPAHLTGRTVFGTDVALRDMLKAVVLRPPALGSRAMQVNGKVAGKVPGVREILKIDAGVAVVADDIWSALRGREALRVRWSKGPRARLTTARIIDGFKKSAHRPGEVIRNDGDALKAIRRRRDVIETAYTTPYIAHATMEPMNCTAHVRDGHCEVWVPTQAQTRAQKAAAQAAGVSAREVEIHSTFVGGGFGRRLDNDYVSEAVQISKAVHAPVQVLWTRDDDLRHDHYRPASYTRLWAKLDGDRQPLAWMQRIAGPKLALHGVDVPYEIPNIREEHVLTDPGIPTGPWRSVGCSQNAFVIESFIDELAHAASTDPLAFRLRLLTRSPRQRAVLELAAEKAGWGTTAPHGHHRGIAGYFSFGSWVAEVAEVSVDDGKIRVHRVVCAIDCGSTINPDTIAAQLEGAVANGLTAALKAQIMIDEGGVVQHGFRDYPLLTQREMPIVDVHIVPSREMPGGVGEPGVPPVAPAVANAVFAATGRRLRDLPLRLS